MTASNNPESTQYYAPFDRLPEGAIFVMTIVIQNQDFRKKKLEKLKKRARKCTDQHAQKARVEAEVAEEMIAMGNALFPVGMGVYIRGNDLEDLLANEDKTLAVLANHRFKPLPEDKDTIKLDRYIRFVPMNYQYAFDKKHMLQSRLCSIRQIASVFPLYGRSRGSKHPCFSFLTG